MSKNKAITGNAARKARKKAGIQFFKEPKTPTPLLERSWFTAVFPGVAGTRNAGKPMPRSKKKIDRALAARGITPDEVA
jgi:hypothetical protein